MAETRELSQDTLGDLSTIELDLDDPLVLAIMKAMASKTRLTLLRLLKEKHLDVCGCAKALNQTEANISAQIKILEKVRLISPKYEAGRHGVKKVCEPHLERIIINI